MTAIEQVVKKGVLHRSVGLTLCEKHKTAYCSSAYCLSHAKQSDIIYECVCTIIGPGND